jgi:hypothetical protein
LDLRRRRRLIVRFVLLRASAEEEQVHIIVSFVERMSADGGRRRRDNAIARHSRGAPSVAFGFVSVFDSGKRSSPFVTFWGKQINETCYRDL